VGLDSFLKNKRLGEIRIKAKFIAVTAVFLVPVVSLKDRDG
jgi:hypothetical protein